MQLLLSLPSVLALGGRRSVPEAVLAPLRGGRPSSDEVRRAYNAAARLTHPDKQASAGDALIEAAKVFGALTDAHRRFKAQTEGGAPDAAGPAVAHGAATAAAAAGGFSAQPQQQWQWQQPPAGGARPAPPAGGAAAPFPSSAGWPYSSRSAGGASSLDAFAAFLGPRSSAPGLRTARSYPGTTWL